MYNITTEEETGLRKKRVTIYFGHTKLEVMADKLGQVNFK